MPVEDDANEVSKEVNVASNATRFKVISGAKSEPPPDPAPVSMRDLEGLFREHHDRVFRAAYRVTGSVVDAEDVLQTVFLRLSRRSDLNLEPSPVSYLRRAAINAALDLLRHHTWVGNVRELRNVIERATIVTMDETLRAEHLPEELRGEERALPNRPQGALLTLAEVEARHIARVLAHTSGQIGAAAEILGIHRNTLTRKMREYGL